jgi:hypothetical protein
MARAAAWSRSRRHGTGDGLAAVDPGVRGLESGAAPPSPSSPKSLGRIASGSAGDVDRHRTGFATAIWRRCLPLRLSTSFARDVQPAGPVIQ